MIRTATRADEAAASALLVLAFATDPMTRWTWPAADEEALRSLLQRTAPARIRGDLAAILKGMGRYHPGEPHWYLPLIGVDPARQGRGLGSALMRHALAACDRDRLPAYLESSSPANIPLYERHGFERLGAIQSGDSPTVVPMLRKPPQP